MQDGKKLVTFILSAAAVLGPLAYVLFAFYEMGRLIFFGAPIEFLQISSFGILPVVKTVYPAIMVTFLMVVIISGVQFASPRRKVILGAAAFTYGALILFNLSMTPMWRWIFGVFIFIGIFSALVIKQFTIEFTNDLGQDDEKEQQFIKNFHATSRYIYYLCGAAFFLLCFSAAGSKYASTNDYYWVTGDYVVLGFYGDQVLIGERHGFEVGPKFRVAELKSLEGSLMQLRVGPLKAASMWQSSLPAERASQ
ncbi:hypothetical protein [Pseudomonas sp. 35 E 8]|uniref:hypothetical protein n=1 Tax=Pseudomonas sp. 35 E 8 TaxID=1844103 RepID=UPI0008123FAC|nr:hypothetical protein [Pseudomonas sp. 35 E 8]CRM61965.1 hypothetical protein [Pseudomonas sp. 35 E 8]